jgi:hypothetical protein
VRRGSTLRGFDINRQACGSPTGSMLGLAFDTETVQTGPMIELLGNVYE